MVYLLRILRITTRAIESTSTTMLVTATVFDDPGLGASPPKGGSTGVGYMMLSRT